MNLLLFFFMTFLHENPNTVDMSCGDFTSEKLIYFRSPGFPSSHRNSKMCRLRVGKRDRNICQYRVDLNTFEIAPPFNGNCSQDIFVVSGQNENNIIPKICGKNSGQHCECHSSLCNIVVTFPFDQMFFLNALF